MTIPEPPVRRFTVEEANRTLPLVRMIVQDIVELYTDLERRRDRLVALRARSTGRARGLDDPYEAEVIQMEVELESDVERLQGFVDELRDIGAEMKDPAIGLVDFPAVLNGQDVFLCWRQGESSVAFWHDLESGVGGRRALDVTPPTAGTDTAELGQN
ncbi:MAG: DUF2203 domain-containing protein [Planctomycetaceae bacterium]